MAPTRHTEDGREEEKKLTINIHSLSEFPSLSSAPQQHSSQGTWGNSTQRATAQGHLQRPHVMSGDNGLVGASLAHSSLAQAHVLPQDGSIGASHFTSGPDDFRFGGAQNGIGQMPGSSMQPKTSSIEDFPPLGRSPTGEVGPLRREDLTRDTEVGDHAHRNGFEQSSNPPSTHPRRSDLLGDVSSLLDGNRQHRFNGGLMGDIGGLDSGLISG